MTTPAQRLKTEVDTDPIGRGYAGMTDQQVADDLRTAYRTGTRSTMDSSEIYEHVDRAEFASKTALDQERIKIIYGLGNDVKVGPGSKARNEFIAIFGAGSATITALASALSTSISRAEELGLGAVDRWAVNDARNA